MMSQPLSVNVETGTKKSKKDTRDVFLGRVCKYAFLVIDNKTSELIRREMNQRVINYEKDGYFLQRIPSGHPLHEGYGLLMDIIKTNYELTSPEGVKEMCRDRQLWRFFSDNDVDNEEWMDVLGKVMGEIKQLSSLDEA